MANTRNSRAAALAALRAYQATYAELGGFETNGDGVDTQDLIVDLAHLSDTFTGDDAAGGEHTLEAAADAYAEETECEGHESLDAAHMGETVYCDGSCRTCS